MDISGVVSCNCKDINFLEVFTLALPLIIKPCTFYAKRRSWGKHNATQTFVSIVPFAVLGYCDCNVIAKIGACQKKTMSLRQHQNFYYQAEKEIYYQSMTWVFISLSYEQLIVLCHVPIITFQYIFICFTKIVP